MQPDATTNATSESASPSKPLALETSKPPQSRQPGSPQGRVFGAFIYRLAVIVLLAYIALTLHQSEFKVYIMNSGKWSAIPVNVQDSVHIGNSFPIPVRVER